jgi:hypothetical protein
MDFGEILPVSATDAFKSARALVAGRVIDIQCPEWCEADHIRDHADVAEIAHMSDGFGVPMPADVWGERFALTTWQVSGAGSETCALVMPSDASAPADRVTFNAEQLRDFADNLSAHAERLRSLAVRLSAAEHGLMS